MKQLAESTPGGWAGIGIKYGPAWVLLFWMTNALLGGFTTDLSAIAGDARAIRAEHMQMGFYLHAVCVGVNQGESWRCDPGGR